MRDDMQRTAEIIRRKSSSVEAANLPRKKLVDLLVLYGIITDNTTGTLTMYLQNGGIRGSKLELIDPL